MENLVRVFSGSEASALLLKTRLEEAGIDALIKNDSADAFWGAAPPVVDLYIREESLNKAESIIKDFPVDPE